MKSRIPDTSVKALRTAAVGICFLMQGASSLHACPGCKKLSEEVGRVEPQTVMAGFAFSWSVLFMLAVVFAVLGFLTVFITKTVAAIDRRNQNL